MPSASCSRESGNAPSDRRRAINARRRESIRRADLFLSSAARIIASVLELEQDALDGTPENLQGTDRYVRSEEAVELLSDASDTLEEVMQKLQDAASV